MMMGGKLRYKPKSLNRILSWALSCAFVGVYCVSVWAGLFVCHSHSFLVLLLVVSSSIIIISITSTGGGAIWNINHKSVLGNKASSANQEEDRHSGNYSNASINGSSATVSTASKRSLCFISRFPLVPPVWQAACQPTNCTCIPSGRIRRTEFTDPVGGIRNHETWWAECFLFIIPHTHYATISNNINMLLTRSPLNLCGSRVIGSR